MEYMRSLSTLEYDVHQGWCFSDLFVGPRHTFPQTVFLVVYSSKKTTSRQQMRSNNSSSKSFGVGHLRSTQVA